MPVKGNMLTGMSEEAAVIAASRGVEIEAYGHLFTTAHDMRRLHLRGVWRLFPARSRRLLDLSLGWTALGLAGFAFLFIVAAVVVLPFFIHTTKNA